MYIDGGEISVGAGSFDTSVKRIDDGGPSGEEGEHIAGMSYFVLCSFCS